MVPQTLFITRYVLYFGILLFAISFTANAFNVFPILLFEVLHVVLFAIALWYLYWHYTITKGHRTATDRISEGAILLLIIYNPFMPFLLEYAVWMFLDAVFLWIFVLYLQAVSDIERNIKEGRENWNALGDEI